MLCAPATSRKAEKMIRTRLALAFALVATLAVGQAVAAWWGAKTAANHAERRLTATLMLAEYLALAGDKQRLKVWFAEDMLAGNATPAQRDRLVTQMRDSLGRLRELADRGSGSADYAIDLAGIELLALNVDALQSAVLAAKRPGASDSVADQWRGVIRAFDELSGQDMREMLRASVARKEAISAAENRRLAATLAGVREGNAGIALLVLLLCAAAVVYFVRTLERPFAELARLSERLGRGEFDARSGLSGRDEFARIGRLLDSMAARLAAAQASSAALQRQLDALVSERTRAVSQAYEALTGLEARRRQFLAELSHELRTPVTVIRGEAEIALRQGLDGESGRDALRRIVEASSELGGRVQDLLEAARAGAAEYAFERRPLALGAIAEAACSQMQAVARHRGVELQFHPPQEAAWVQGDRERLQQALTVVLDNAVRYSPPGGRVEVRLATEEGGWVLRVEDEGPGMEDDEIDRAFEPHFRGRSAARLEADGTGLGLSIAQRIMVAHQGSVGLERRLPRGLRAALYLPRAELAAAL